MGEKQNGPFQLLLNASLKSVTRQQGGLVRWQKRAVGTRQSCWRLLWWQIRRVEGMRSVLWVCQGSNTEIPV